MSKPVDLPDWATNTTYGAGLYPGQANKNKPPSGNIAEGFDPGAGMPVSWFNWILNNHATWIKFLQADNRVVWRERLHPTGAYVATQSPIPNFGTLQIQANGAVSVTFNDPNTVSSLYNGRSATISTPAIGGDYVALFSNAKVVGFAHPDNLRVHAAWSMALDSSAIGANSPITIGGMTDNATFMTGISNGIYVKFEQFLSTHWVFHVDTNRGGGPSSITLAGTYDPASTTFQAFAIDFYGASTPQGVAAGGAYTTFSVNGTVVATINLATNQVPGANCYFGQGIQATSNNVGVFYAGEWDLEQDIY